MSDISSHFPPPNPAARPVGITASPPGETPPPRKSYTGWIVAAVAVGVLLFALAGTGIVLTVLSFAQNVDASNAVEDEGSMPAQEPFVTGEPGAPVAVKPLECPAQCLSYRQVEETAFTKDELFALGLTVAAEGSGVGSAYPANSELDYYEGTWERGNYSPVECFPLTVPEPIAVELGEELDFPNDRIYFVSSYSDRNQWDYVSQSTRIFETTDAASEHMSALAGFVAGCGHYSATTDGGEAWETDITPAPAIVVPDGVAAVGWQEGSSAYRYYSFDVQRANVVVRSTMLVYGITPEHAFREAVEKLATRLGEMQPREG